MTTYIENGEEYDVVVEGERSLQQSPLAMQNIYVKSSITSQLIPLSNVVTYEEFADANTLNRYNRLRSITIEANLKPGYSLGQALAYLENLAKNNLPQNVVISYKGESLDYIESGYSIYFVFTLALIVVYLVMAGLFESFVHPLVIMFSVPLAILGALLGLWLTNQTLNIYSQIGLIMLVGLSAKNGILIVEFINQLRSQGFELIEAIIEGCKIRFRPILMTALTTIVGSLPLIFSFGAGAETRYVLGVVIFFGVLIMTFLTLILIPCLYKLFAMRSASPLAREHLLAQQLKDHPDKI